MTRKGVSNAASVVSTATHPLVLSDGRGLDSGEWLPDVDMSTPHNRSLYFDGHIHILDGFVPKTRHLESEVIDPGEVPPPEETS